MRAKVGHGELTVVSQNEIKTEERSVAMRNDGKSLIQRMKIRLDQSQELRAQALSPSPKQPRQRAGSVLAFDGCPVAFALKCAALNLDPLICTIFPFFAHNSL